MEQELHLLSHMYILGSDPNVVHVGDDLGAVEEQHLNQFASPV